MSTTLERPVGLKESPIIPHQQRKLTLYTSILLESRKTIGQMTYVKALILFPLSKHQASIHAADKLKPSFYEPACFCFRLSHLADIFF